MNAVLTPNGNGHRNTVPERPSDFLDDRVSLTPSGLDALENAPVVPDAEGPSSDLDGLVTGEPKDAPEAFAPRTAEEVDWVLGRIADHKGRAARIRANGEAMARAAEHEAAFLEMRFGAAIQEFVRRDTDGTRRKSTKLYNGVVGFRQKPARVEITDAARALAHAKEHVPAAVVERLDRKAYDKALMESGEVLEFAALVPASDEFYIKTNQGE